MKKPFKIFVISCLFLVGLCLAIPTGFRLWLEHEYHLPSEQRVREQFQNNRADYIYFVSLLQRDQAALLVDGNGRVAINGVRSRAVPEYRDLMRKIRAKDVIVREDGSIEFALYGFGCAVCSDSFMGVRYIPKLRKTDAPRDGNQPLLRL